MRAARTEEPADSEGRSPGAGDLRRCLDDQRAAGLRDGPPALADRLRDLDALKGAVLAHGDRFVEAVSADFGHR